MLKFPLQTAEYMVFGSAVGVLFCVNATALFFGQNTSAILLISIGFLLSGALIAYHQPIFASIDATAVLIVQAIAFATAFQGHPWQIDTYMLFSALLTCLVCMRSVLALLVGTAITAEPYLSLSFLMPALIYLAGDLGANFGHTSLHAVVIVIETGVLLMTVHQLNRPTAKMHVQKNELEESGNSSKHRSVSKE